MISNLKVRDVHFAFISFPDVIKIYVKLIHTIISIYV